MKIGILTYYYANSNYGGLLQAYALQRALGQLGFEAEQIAYDVSLFPPMTPAYRLFGQMRHDLSYYRHKLSLKKRAQSLPQEICDGLRLRKAAMKDFEQLIPHSRQQYTYQNIDEANEQYDTFITGSDQVWNLDWYHPALYLEFVRPGKKKLSYAASMPQTSVRKRQQRFLRRVLSDYSAVSVREKTAADLLGTFTGKPVEQVVDPTLLLDRAQWDEICTPRLIEHDYVFCYYLGGGTEKRRLAEEYAKAHGLQLVTLPYLMTSHRDDEAFGDIRLYDVSPADFISLIKHAQFVFTDSFHASVFSNLYERAFCAVDRSGGLDYMRSRLHSLLEMFGQQQRLLTVADCTLGRVEALEPIDYGKAKAVLSREREKSKAFLLSHIN